MRRFSESSNTERFKATEGGAAERKTQAKRSGCVLSPQPNENGAVALTNKRFVNDEAPFVYKKQTKSKIKACVTLETQAFMVKCIYEKQHLTVQLYT